jgi:hypothetical protein
LIRPRLIPTFFPAHPTGLGQSAQRTGREREMNAMDILIALAELARGATLGVGNMHRELALPELVSLTDVAHGHTAGLLKITPGILLRGDRAGNRTGDR